MRSFGSSLGPVVVGAIAFVVAGAPADAQNAFYKDKRLTIMINYAAGGPTDIEGRLFAKHLAKHIDGQPFIIIQNRDGANGLVGTNYLGEVAPRDGTVAGYLTGAAWQYIGDPGSHKVDFKSYEFIAYQPGTTIYYARTDTPPGLKQPADLIKATGLVVGGLGADGPKDLLLRLPLDMLGLKFKYVTGYRSSAAARLALQRDEINMYSESPPSYRSVIEPMANRGEVVPLWYDPSYDGTTLAVPKQVEGMRLLPFHEFYRSVKGAMPSGIHWDVMRTILSVNTAMQRMVVLPPEVPQGAIAALRAAVQALNADGAFAEEATKSLGFVPDYVAGADTNQKVRNALNAPEAVRSFVVQYIKDAGK
jgi:tripartite-type tricarboxylate transporter receptor subunit TctC